jgi:hypothetical protein
LVAARSYQGACIAVGTKLAVWEDEGIFDAEGVAGCSSVTVTIVRITSSGTPSFSVR